MTEKKKTIKEDDDKSAKLDEALENIEKAFGKGSIMKLGDRPNVNIGKISSGSIMLDQALGIGGYPKGRIIEIYGPESSGKTTLALHAIAACQAEGGRAAFIDAEHAIDPEYSANLGVRIDDLILSQPDNGEQALEIVDMLAKSDAIDLIVVDSVAALVTKAEIDGTMSDLQMGGQARLMSKALRKLAGQLSKSNCTVIFINQLRDKLGNSYGPSETTSGGRALKFYASVRIDIRKFEQIKVDDKIVGNFVTVKVVKNKVAPPFKNCKLEIVFGEGVSHYGELADLALGFEFAEKSGSWYSLFGERVGQGRDALKNYLKANKSIAHNLEDKIIDSFKNNLTPDSRKMK